MNEQFKRFTGFVDQSIDKKPSDELILEVYGLFDDIHQKLTEMHKTVGTQFESKDAYQRLLDEIKELIGQARQRTNVLSDRQKVDEGILWGVDNAVSSLENFLATSKWKAVKSYLEIILQKVVDEMNKVFSS